MSMNETGTNQSAATTTESTNQSAATTAASTETQPEANHSDPAFEKEIDEEWGLSQEETEEEIPEQEEPETEETEAEESPEQGEETEATEEPEAETELESREPKESTLRVNYMGKAYDLPEDEARKYAQIGMNAGRLQEKYDALKPLEKLRDTLGIMATFRGQSTDKLIDEFSDMNAIKDAEIRGLIDQGTDEAVANELWEAKIKEASQRYTLEKLERSKNPTLTNYQKEQIDAFAKFRPKEHEAVAAGKPLPQEVVDEWRNGTDLSTAWLLHENKDIAKQYSDVKKQISDYKKEIDTLKKEKAKLLKNAENKTKAPTSKKGLGGGTGHDSIYSGWDKY